MIDVLTGMPGRNTVLDALESELQRHTDRQQILAVIVVDIPHFTNINKLLGYRLADHVLKTISRQLLDMKRTRDIAGRTGDHEFVLILPEIDYSTIAELAVNRIIATLEQPYTVNGVEVPISPTIGIAMFPENGVTCEDLLIKAQTASQLARERNQPYILADNPTDDNRLNDEKLEIDLISSISNSELELYYQPKANLATRQLSGAEALIRWHHPEYGLLSPSRFISIVENGKMLLPITIWTINTALHQASEIRKIFPGFRIAVNLSACLLEDPDLVEMVIQSLSIWDTEPQHLIMEITESAMMRNPDACMKNLQGLNEAGIMLSIDDFGTGYSSFSYLKRMPVQELKIDQSFIRNLLQDNNDIQIVQAIIDLGRHFNLRVVAEGIETSEVLERLITMGCKYGQGYLIARPLDYKSMLRWLEETEWNPGRESSRLAN